MVWEKAEEELRSFINCHHFDPFIGVRIDHHTEGTSYRGKDPVKFICSLNQGRSGHFHDEEEHVERCSGAHSTYDMKSGEI